MATVGLTPGHEFLRNAAQACFSDHYADPAMHQGQALSQNLEWVPALRFTIRKYINVFVEPSEDGPYPRLFDMRYVEVNEFPQPIAVYSVCPASVIGTTQGQRDVKRLQSRGFGLVTVDELGDATILFPAIPLIQWISDGEFKQRVAGLPKGIRQRASEAFVDYRSNPVNGVKSLSELLEGMVTKAAADASTPTSTNTTKGSTHVPTAVLLGNLHTQLPKAQAAIGAARAFINYYRNLSQHWPSNKKAAYEKFAGCRHQFLEGLRTVAAFREAMRTSGLTGKVAPN
ncbi:MAG: hypothetical protein OXQ90_04040 [Gammaproteobacteria bacterium]|nr:hypothetical protein [Gammaproteobacteria bacterium]